MAEVSGGDRIAKRLHELATKLGHAPAVKIGFHSGDTYPGGMPLALVAALNEYGAPTRGIPPRPFMRMTIAAHRTEWSRQIAERLRHHEGDAAKAMSDMGETIQGEIQDTIRSNVPPPNARSTVKRKGFDRTLEHTGFMLQHVRWTLEETD